MYLILLILGLALWALAHLFKRLRPEQRAAMGDKGKGPVALALIVSLALMVVGYRGADFVTVWSPPAFLTHVNNLLVLIGFLMFGAGSVGSWLASRMRHPMLTGFKIWAVAHLLVNGDLASILLFGGLLAWAVAQVIVINRTEGAWAKPPRRSPTARDARLVVVWLVLFGVAAAVHVWLGKSPFGG